MNIYVGNLNWNMSDDDLRNLFEPFGEVVSARLVTDKMNNDRSKGFGFVEMADDEAGRNAISNLNEKDVLGRKIVVNEARPKTEDSRRSYGGGGSRGGFERRGGGDGYNNRR